MALLVQKLWVENSCRIPFSAIQRIPFFAASLSDIHLASLHQIAPNFKPRFSHNPYFTMQFKKTMFILSSMVFVVVKSRQGCG